MTIFLLCFHIVGSPTCCAKFGLFARLSNPNTFLIIKHSDLILAESSPWLIRTIIFVQKNVISQRCGFIETVGCDCLLIGRNVSMNLFHEILIDEAFANGEGIFLFFHLWKITDYKSNYTKWLIIKVNH